MKRILFILMLVPVVASAQSRAALFIDTVAAKDHFNGTVLIRNKTGVVYRKSFGMANFQFGVPNKTETKYKIASITKLFTSVLIMQLAEQGKLDVNKRITDYLPDFKGESGRATIRQLLNHTSGIANIDTVTSMESALINGLPLYQKPRTPDELLGLCGKLANEPGKTFDYNNADYIVLGKIIESITGKTYGRAVTEAILQPLGLQNTGVLYQQDIVAGLADTYFQRDDLKKLVPDLPVYMENWYAAGCMYSTVNDLAVFTGALFGKRLLKQASLDSMFVSGMGEYGFGVWVYKDYGISNRNFTIIKRPGRIMGAQAMIFHILEEGSTIIILSNTGNMSLDDFAAKIAERVVP